MAKLNDLSDHRETYGLARRALVSFLLTFIAARTMVFLIMSKRVPNFYFFLGDTHVHHLNYGIFLLAAVGGYVLFADPSNRAMRYAAFVYGIAMGLTFDEFGMWLHLGGSYWQRVSVDAIIVVAGIFALCGYARAIRVFEAKHLRAFLALLLAVCVFGVVLYDTSIRIGAIEGPRLHELEMDSSP